MNQSMTLSHGFARMNTDVKWVVSFASVVSRMSRELARTLLLSVLIRVHPWLIVSLKARVQAG
jgi:hypothetical protein